MSAPAIRLEAVRKSYGGRAVVDGVDLEIEPGGCLVLLGLSGCGKSTTLRTVNRLVVPDSGRILVGGRDVSTLAAHELRRGIGYAIQSTGLFPHWSVARNVATVPRLLGWPEARIRNRVDALLELCGLPPERFRDARPGRLSGGQAQRVGFARALAADPPILLMDEPFGALDPITRERLRGELRRLCARENKTVVLVTHDVDEALSLATRVAVMEAGRVRRIATPAALLADPGDDHVRALLGGGEIGLRRLALAGAYGHAEPGDPAGLPALPPDATLRAALAAMAEHRTDRVAIGPDRVLTRDRALGGAR